MSTVTDDRSGHVSCLTIRNDDKAGYDDWLAACKAAGEPLSFDTNQPIAGKDIHHERFDYWQNGPRGSVYRRLVPVLGPYMQSHWHWNDDAEDLVDEPEALDYDSLSPLELQICPHCQSRRHPRTAHRSVYCTPFCQRAARYAKGREARALEPRECEQCSETFEPTRSDARYCSSACRQRAYRQRA